LRPIDCGSKAAGGLWIETKMSAGRYSAQLTDFRKDRISRNCAVNTNCCLTISYGDQCPFGHRSASGSPLRRNLCPFCAHVFKWSGGPHSVVAVCPVL